MRTPPTIAASEQPEAPDWSQITHDVLCPLCEYNLRGLREPRCPECGYRFDWPEILEEKRGEHPYLFEHHPRHNAWSYWQTLRGTWRPRSFFKTLHPAQKSRPGRLLVFWLLGLPLLLLANLAMYSASIAVEVNVTNHQRSVMQASLRNERSTLQSIVTQWGSVDQYLDQYWPKVTFTTILVARLNSGQFPAELLYNHLMVPLAWPWLLFLALLVFQISMRRARIKTIHVLRCVLYSYDLSVWSGMLILTAIVASFFWDGRTFEGAVRLARDLAILLGTYRVWVAYREYLRFDHPRATVVSAQVIAILFALTLYCLVGPYGALRELLTDPLIRLVIGASA